MDKALNKRLNEVKTHIPMKKFKEEYKSTTKKYLEIQKKSSIFDYSPKGRIYNCFLGGINYSVELK